MLCTLNEKQDRFQQYGFGTLNFSYQDNRTARLYSNVDNPDNDATNVCRSEQVQHCFNRELSLGLFFGIIFKKEDQ